LQNNFSHGCLENQPLLDQNSIENSEPDLNLTSLSVHASTANSQWNNSKYFDGLVWTGSEYNAEYNEIFTP
jgi:hypothetical protein